MEVLSFVLVIISGVSLFMSMCFLIPAKVVGMMSDTTEGIIKGTTDDAAKYNGSIVKEIGEVGLQVKAGVGSKYSLTRSYSRKFYHVIYFYEVDGVEYSRADGLGYNKGLAEKRIGEKVTVYYDSQNPLRASLSSGVVYRVLSISFLVIGVLGGIVGVAYQIGCI